MVENAVLKAEVTQLRERVAKLERLVSRNSGNSGMPPSADELPGEDEGAEVPEAPPGWRARAPRVCGSAQA
ncbi:DUF6444 domain-containing protein [Nonomuraea sp. CA-143628]|uniref:DUF6444 domain-containing protein n=1 Tax=Nonomuraea sp. CA-143628 TaxID=3239997 RepID=UPI003D8BB30B